MKIVVILNLRSLLINSLFIFFLKRFMIKKRSLVESWLNDLDFKNMGILRCFRWCDLY